MFSKAQTSKAADEPEDMAEESLNLPDSIDKAYNGLPGMQSFTNHLTGGSKAR